MSESWEWNGSECLTNRKRVRVCITVGFHLDPASCSLPWSSTLNTMSQQSLGSGTVLENICFIGVIQKCISTHCTLYQNLCTMLSNSSGRIQLNHMVTFNVSVDLKSYVLGQARILYETNRSSHMPSKRITFTEHIKKQSNALNSNLLVLLPPLAAAAAAQCRSPQRGPALPNAVFLAGPAGSSREQPCRPPAEAGCRDCTLTRGG